jgi:(p)ppGpp synthase/HD superfamily hydrolase
MAHSAAIEKARAFAVAKQDGQEGKRPDEPYIQHIHNVVELLRRWTSPASRTKSGTLMAVSRRVFWRDRIEASKNKGAVRTVMQTVLGPLPRSETL